MFPLRAICRIEPELLHIRQRALLGSPCRWLPFVSKELFCIEGRDVVTSEALGFFWFCQMEDKPRPSSSCPFPSPYSWKLAWRTSGPFQELLEMVLSPGTTSCLRTEDAAFSHCLIPVIMFALASFSPSSSVRAVLFSTASNPLVFPCVIFAPSSHVMVTC